MKERGREPDRAESGTGIYASRSLDLTLHYTPECSPLRASEFHLESAALQEAARLADQTCSAHARRELYSRRRPAAAAATLLCSALFCYSARGEIAEFQESLYFSGTPGTYYACACAGD